MKLIYVFIIIIIIILLIILIYTLKNANSCCIKYHNYLTGLWVGDPEFIKKSNLSDFKLFIGPRENKKRNGYIIMLDKNNDFILNKAISLQESSTGHTQRWSAHSANKQTDDKFNIQYLLNTDVNNVFPKQINFLVSMNNGVLTVNNNGKIYALLTKDLLASAEAIKAYASH
jgi:hypothetical protein